MPRLYFSAEVKREAVDIVLHSRLTVSSVAQQIGCSVNALHNWLQKHRQTVTIDHRVAVLQAFWQSAG